jgi:hypothetical protein
LTYQHSNDEFFFFFAQVFYKPLQKLQILTEQEMDTLFFNLPDVLKLNRIFCDELEAALLLPREKQNFGEVFLRKVKRMNTYTQRL